MPLNSVRYQNAAAHLNKNAYFRIIKKEYMAPEKNPEVKAKQVAKELTLWSQCKKNKSVPKEFVSLHSAQRNFSISYKVLVMI